MKGCLKFVIYGVIGIAAIAVVYSLLNPNSKKGDNSNTESTIESSANTETDETNENFENSKSLDINKSDFDLSKSELVKKIKDELSNCYESAKNMSTLTDTNLEIEKNKGNESYNRAYDLFTQLQTEAGDNLPRAKSKVITESLKTYSEIFNNRYAIAQNYIPEIDYIKKNLETFPQGITQIEKDNEEGVIRLIVGSRSKRQINLPSGTWCLWEIIGGDKIWLEGKVPNNGYAKFDVATTQLPMYLGAEKRFIIGPNLSNVQLIFKECEKQ